MWYLPCRLISPIPEDATEYVTAELTDESGRRHTFRDKLAIFRGEDRADGIRCHLQQVGRIEQRFAYWVSTAQPDHVAATPDERTEFVVDHCVFRAQLFDYRHRYSSIRRAAPDVPLDIDQLQHRIALALDILPAGTSFDLVKWMYWTTPSDVGDFTLAVLHDLRRLGVLIESASDPCVLFFTDT